MNFKWTQVQKYLAGTTGLVLISGMVYFSLQPKQSADEPQASLAPYFSSEQSFIGRGNVENLDLAEFHEPTATDLTPPESIWMIAGTTNVTVNWARHPLATQYEVSYGEEDKEQRQSAIVSTPFFNLRNILPNKSYNLEIKSIDADGNKSSASTRLAVTPTNIKQSSVTEKIDFEVAAWMPSDINVERTSNSYERGVGTLTEINPFWYNFSTDGKLEPKGGARDPELVARSKQNNMVFVPTITNNFDAKRVSQMFKNKNLQQTLIKDITTEVTTYGYAGIDIDFENIYTADKEAYTQFIKELSDSLHAEKKILEVTVQPKKSDKDVWDGPGAIDADHLPKYADRIKVMTYDYSRPNTDPGPIAPIPWVLDVINYWKTKMPADNILAGVPFYGYDWSLKTADDVGIDWDSVVKTKDKYDTQVGYDQQAEEPYYTYDAKDGSHVVFYQDAQSVAKKVAAIKNTGVAGIAAWVLGGDDPNNFLAISNETKEIKSITEKPLNIGLKIAGNQLAVSLTKFSEIESFNINYGSSPDNLDNEIKDQRTSIVDLPDLKPGEVRYVRATAFDHSGKEIRKSGIAQVIAR